MATRPAYLIENGKVVRKDYDFTWISGLSAFIYGSFILRYSVFLLPSSSIVVTRSAISPR